MEAFNIDEDKPIIDEFYANLEKLNNLKDQFTTLVDQTYRTTLPNGDLDETRTPAFIANIFNRVDSAMVIVNSQQTKISYMLASSPNNIDIGEVRDAIQSQKNMIKLFEDAIKEIKEKAAKYDKNRPEYINDIGSERYHFGRGGPFVSGYDTIEDARNAQVKDLQDRDWKELQNKSGLDKIWGYAKYAANKGRDYVAKLIAKLNSWMKKIDGEMTLRGGPSGILEKLKLKIARVVEWLSRKLHNTIQKYRGNISDKTWYMKKELSIPKLNESYMILGSLSRCEIMLEDVDYIISRVFN